MSHPDTLQRLVRDPKLSYKQQFWWINPGPGETKHSKNLKTIRNRRHLARSTKGYRKIHWKTLGKKTEGFFWSATEKKQQFSRRFVCLGFHLGDLGGSIRRSILVHSARELAKTNLLSLISPSFCPHGSEAKVFGKAMRFCLERLKTTSPPKACFAKWPKNDFLQKSWVKTKKRSETTEHTGFNVAWGHIDKWCGVACTMFLRLHLCIHPAGDQFNQTSGMIHCTWIQDVKNVKSRNEIQCFPFPPFF